MDDTISRQAAIDAVCKYCEYYYNENVIQSIKEIPSAQPEIIRCKDCEYGSKDDEGRWYCLELGYTMGSDDGSGFCSDAERRTDE